MTVTTLNLTNPLGVLYGGTGTATPSGTYTPTVSAAANTDSTPTVTVCQYIRVGSTVHVSGSFTADPTLAATSTSFEMTLPVASDIGATKDLSGVAFC